MIGMGYFRNLFRYKSQRSLNSAQAFKYVKTHILIGEVYA